MQGSQIGLCAIGRQDPELFDAAHPHDHIQFPFKQYSDFTKVFRHYDSITTGSSRWPFSETVTFKLNPKTTGDLLTNAFIKLELVPPPFDTDNVGIRNKKFFACENLGLSIIEELKFRVNDQIIEIMDDYMRIGKDDIFNTSKSRINKAFSQNGECVNFYDSVPLNFMTYSTGKSNIPYAGFPISYYNVTFDGTYLYIDLDMFFSTKHKQNKNTYGFPLCAVYNQDVYIEIKFRQQEWFTNSPYDVSCNKITLVTEEINLSPEEKFYLSHSEFFQTIVLTEKQIETDIDNSNGVKNNTDTNQSNSSPNEFKIELQSNIPLKAVYWTVQRKDFLKIETPAAIFDGYLNPTNQTNFMNRYNFSNHKNVWIDNYYYGQGVDIAANEYISLETFKPIISECAILNSKNDIAFKHKTDFLDQYGALFFRSTQGSSRNLNDPTRNIYIYCFDKDGLTKEQSGFENYSIMKKTIKHTLVINLINKQEIQSNVYVLRVYNVGLKKLYFKNGFVSVGSFTE